jgi:DNA polymerase-3 subunit delta
MDYYEALAEIKRGQVRPLYLLYGEETYLARRLEQAIVDSLLPPEDRDMSLTVLDRDSPLAELINLVETVPFLGGKNVILSRGTNLFRGGKGEDGGDAAEGRLLKLLENIPEYSHLVFAANEADKRRKLYKAVERCGAVVDVSPVKAKDVRPWLMAKLGELGKKMAPDAMEHLLSAVSLMPQLSLGLLDGELEKMALYAAGPAISRKDVMTVMAAVPEVSVFAMVEAVSQKQTAKALTMLEEQLAAGESAIKLLALLARQVRHLWLARELAGRGADSRKVAEELGVPPFVGEKLVRQSRGFAAPVLRRTMVAFAAADRDLKSGRADKFVLEKLVIEMCR